MSVSKRNVLSTMGLILVLASVHVSRSHAESLNLCQQAHRKAISTCAAHEHTASAETLEVVSVDTRTRVIATQYQRLETIQSKCEQARISCTRSCTDAMENSILAGEDLSSPLDQLQDCEQGVVLEHLRKISERKRKLEQLRQASY